MFKKVLSLAVVSAFAMTTLGYTTADTENAYYLAGKNIINYQRNPADFQFNRSATRVEIASMALKIGGFERNGACRGDFPDTPNATGSTTCIIMESAADHGIINSQADRQRMDRRVNPYAAATKAETLHMLLTQVTPSDLDDEVGYGFYWAKNFPVHGEIGGYKDVVQFSSDWQAAAFYAYIRKILANDDELSTKPQPNRAVSRNEAFWFARNIVNYLDLQKEMDEINS